MNDMVPEELREARRAEIARYADVAMYEAAPSTGTEPVVTLVSMTSNPLRVMAAASELYAGRVMRNPAEVSRETALRWFADMTKTKLQAPLEFVNMHFLFENVTRAFTHQLVRQRTAVYVQESQRFAVKQNAEFEVALPPSLVGLKEDDPKLVIWQTAVKHLAQTYNALINAGVPAEDARGLLPTNIMTKVHYHTNLRALADHAGMRLCSQAQYEWKQVWAGILRAIVDYPLTHPYDSNLADQWQYNAVANLFKPVCYQTGKCEFMAETDRWCRIRERVEAHHRVGQGSEFWTDIDSREALMEGAARLPMA